MNLEQREYLATEVVSCGAELVLFKQDVCSFHYTLNDAIEETLNRDFAQEVLRGVMAHRIDLRKSYEADLIEYVGDMIETWIDEGYTMEVK